MSLRKYSLIIGLIVLISAYCWLISYGTMSLSQGEMRGSAYDSLGNHLLYGSAEVDPKAIESESFIEDGKTFMYFGPFPAVLRIIPNEILPSMYGRWSRWSCLLAGLLSVLAFFRILLDRVQKYPGRIRSRLLLATTVGFAFGTPIVFLMSCGFIYHEAIIWGLCWSLWGLWFWLKISYADYSLDNLVGLSACAGLALLSRVTFAVPLLLILGVSSIRWFLCHRSKVASDLPILLWRSLKILSPALSCLTFQFWYNYARFGSPLVFIDTAHHTSLNIAPGSYQERLSELGLFNLGRVWIGLNNYLGFDPRFFSSHMPFISVSQVRLDTIHYPVGYAEWTLPLVICSPWLIILGIIGVKRLITKRKWTDLLSTLILAIPAFLICVFYFITQRYSAEFIPLLVFLSTAGTEQIIRCSNKPILQKLAVLSIEIFCLISVLATGLSTFGWNAKDNWAAPKEYRQQIVSSFAQIDSFLGQ